MIHQYQIGLLGNLLISFLPRDRFKSIANPFQWPPDPMGTVQFLQVTMPFWTNHPEISIPFGIPLNFPKPSILHEGEYRATVTTSITEGWNLCDRCLRARTRPIPKVKEFLAESNCSHPGGRCLQKTPSR